MFHVDGDAGERLRAWDRLDGDLVERVVEDERTPCLTLDLTFVLAPLDDGRLGLRLARSSEGSDLVLLATELVVAAREAAADARDAQARAEARIRELEAQLAARGV